MLDNSLLIYILRRKQKPKNPGEAARLKEKYSLRDAEAQENMKLYW